MKPAFTIHSVHVGKKQHAPKTVIDVTEKDFDDLEALGAIRAPSDEELALHSLSTKSAAKPAKRAKKAPTKKSAAKSKAKDETDDEPDTGADKDADVTPKGDSDDLLGD